MSKLLSTSFVVEASSFINLVLTLVEAEHLAFASCLGTTWPNRSSALALTAACGGNKDSYPSPRAISLCSGLQKRDGNGVAEAAPRLSLQGSLNRNRCNK